jgi:hypothetical protein
VVPSWLISYSKEEVTATSKSKEQREVAETIEEVNKKEVTFLPYKYRVSQPIEGNQPNRNKPKLSYSCSISLYPKFCPNPNLMFFLHPSSD